MFNSKMKTVSDVKMFFDYLVNDQSLNFHPDTSFQEYIKPDWTPAFTEEERSHYNLLMEKAFEICDCSGVDIYEIGMETLLNCNG